MGRCQSKNKVRRQKLRRRKDQREKDHWGSGRRCGKGRPRWTELSAGRRAAIAATAAAQLGLAGAAWCDLARRPADQVRGPKWRWALVIAVNWIGPIAYFVRGRRRD